MELRTVATVLPTAVSAGLYAGVHATFFLEMIRRPTNPLPPIRPWVSILKPVAGADDELQDNLASFAALDYPAYEILIGVASPADPAVPIVEAFLAAHPALPAQLVWTRPAPPGKNPKVAQLLELTRRARGSVLVVSDANVRVPRTYLRSLVDRLLRPGVGLVSSVIVGGGERSLGAALENAQLGAAIAPVVVSAPRLAGRPITVGKSMAMRRADLERAGGWESVAAVLAEDDVLGQRFHALGYGVEVCLCPVENRNVATPVQRTIERHARWAKMRRAVTPTCFALEPLLSPLLVAAIAAIALPSPLAARIVLAALGLQLAGALLVHTLLGARRPLLLAALEPARVALGVACYALALASRRVCWRGHTFVLEEGSRLVPVTGEGAVDSQRFRVIRGSIGRLLRSPSWLS
jgi:ceramide glucosyltransferase